ncbi:uncharacterized protein LOC141685734 [Apium graveolens]|uniref:uncharacterized protein LOC141685734 n=1 Tax=Apium graveolens TaxID=4045 RepID=UPI003D78BCD9
MGPTEDTIKIPVDEKDPIKVLKIRSQLTSRMKGGLSIFLMENLDVFAWNHSDMVGIDPEVMFHLLNIDSKHKGIRQKHRAWRTCVDFTDLNKACPKDNFPLPRIDQLVDVTAGHALLSFMDAYSGYNQIPMYGPDQEHTSFITDRGLYCYIGMPFGLINVGTTYQRLVNKMFKNKIGKMMEVYVDNMMVKSKRAEDHIADLAEIFHIVRKYMMKLNPHNCIFGMEPGKFLGFMGNAPFKVREEFPHPWWVLHVDGAMNNNGRIILVTSEGHHLMSAIHFKFYVTNNDAEYKALINGLKIALEVGVVNLIARSDSELVVNQVNGGFQARGPRTELYIRCVQRLFKKFGSTKLEGVPREEISNADAFAKMGSQMDIVLLGKIPLGIQEIPSIPEVSVFQMQDTPQETWMTPTHNCIQAGTLTEDKLQARCLRYQAVKYVEYDGVLYKSGFNQSLL